MDARKAADAGIVPFRLGDHLYTAAPQFLDELRKVADAKATIECVQRHYQPAARSVDFTDGVSMEFDRWRFNLRSSNTEPLIRLNVESRGDAALMRERTTELLQMIGGVEDAH